MNRPRSLTIGALLPLLACAACEREPAPEALPDVTVDAESAVMSLPPMWGSLVSGAGMSLILTDGAGPLLRISCARDPAVMSVVAERVQPIASEERLSFGIDDEPFVFVAKLEAGRQVGVEAEAPISDDLLTRLPTATRLSASYGSQTIGPFSPPDPRIVEDFASACREIGGR